MSRSRIMNLKNLCEEDPRPRIFQRNKRTYEDLGIGQLIWNTGSHKTMEKSLQNFEGKLSPAQNFRCNQNIHLNWYECTQKLLLQQNEGRNHKKYETGIQLTGNPTQGRSEIPKITAQGSSRLISLQQFYRAGKRRKGFPKNKCKWSRIWCFNILEDFISCRDWKINQW